MDSGNLIMRKAFDSTTHIREKITHLSRGFSAFFIPSCNIKGTGASPIIALIVSSGSAYNVSICLVALHS